MKLVIVGGVAGGATAHSVHSLSSPSNGFESNKNTIAPNGLGPTTPDTVALFVIVEFVVK